MGSINYYIGSKWATVIAGATLAVAATTTVLVTGGSGGGGGDTFNLAVLQGTNGVDCDTTPTRLTTPVAGASVGLAATACTFDQANDAANSGDNIFVRNDTYSAQIITGDKTSATKFIGESKAGVVVTGSSVECRAVFGADTMFCPDGNFGWYENITIDTNSQANSAAGSLIIGNDVTYKNVDVVGDWPDLSIGSGYDGVDGCATGCVANNFHWNGGTYGDVNPPPRDCVAEPGSNGNPTWVYDSGVIIENVTFNKQYVDLETPNGPCAPNDNQHLEFGRLESGATNATYRFNRFLCGSDSGSGYFYSSAAPSGFKAIGNYFCDNAGSTWAQIDSAPCGYVVAYNYFDGNDAADFTSEGGCAPTWTGNYGTNQGSGGTHVKNVFTGSGSSGTNTYFGATSPGMSTAGVLAPGSPGVNAAEVTTSTIFPSVAPAVDYHGDPRPCGGTFDAGPDELC